MELVAKTGKSEVVKSIACILDDHIVGNKKSHGSLLSCFKVGRTFV